MKFILGIIAAVVIVATISNGGVFGTYAASSALPPAHATAIHAPVVMTKAAGDALSSWAEAQANVNEVDAARNFAQAQNDEANKRRAVATEQALQATRVSNDDAVSKQYATLAAVSIQATAEAISMTMEQNREQYNSTMLSIRATDQAVQEKAINESGWSAANMNRDLVFHWMLPCSIAIVIVFLVALGVVILVRAWPKSEYVAPDDNYHYDEPDPQPAPTIAPQNPGDEARRSKWMADHAVAIRYVEDSIRKLGGTSERLMSAPELESIGGNRESHTRALAHLRELSLIQTKQGGKPEDQGTYVQEAGGDLLYLFNKLITTPPPS